jgi:hypothetical protein
MLSLMIRSADHLAANCVAAHVAERASGWPRRATIVMPRPTLGSSSPGWPRPSVGGWSSSTTWADPDEIEPWWPATASSTGCVLATTRRRDDRLTGGGRTMVDIGAFTKNEAFDSLQERLTEAGGAHLLDDAAEKLVGELGCLPLALSHAAVFSHQREPNPRW